MALPVADKTTEEIGLVRKVILVPRMRLPDTTGANLPLAYEVVSIVMTAGEFKVRVKGARASFSVNDPVKLIVTAFDPPAHNDRSTPANPNPNK